MRRRSRSCFSSSCTSSPSSICASRAGSRESREPAPGRYGRARPAGPRDVDGRHALNVVRPRAVPVGVPHVAQDARRPLRPAAPLLSQWYALGLIDTYQALIYSSLSFTVPFTVWMLVGYFDAIPRDLEESALIDGCGRFGALCRIVLPLAAPGIAATAIFAFVT